MKKSTICRSSKIGPFLALALFGSLLCSSVWSAASSNDLKLDLKAFKVIRKGDQETLVSADKVKPKEVIEYQVRYVNTGEKTLRNIRATLPIPASLVFLSGSSAPSGAMASLDGKSFAAMPLKRKVKLADGTMKVVMVPYSEYRFLRWSLDELAAGKSVTVKARARLQ